MIVPLYMENPFYRYLYYSYSPRYRQSANFGGDDELRAVFLAGYTEHVELDDGYEARRPFYFLSRMLVHAGCLVTLDGYGGPADIAMGRGVIQTPISTYYMDRH